MGFSSFGMINFFYRLWRSKKFRKFVIGFGFLAFVLYTIIGNTNIVYGAQDDSEYTTDTTIAILESYQRNIDIFVQSFNKFYGKNDIITSRFNSIFSDVTSQYNRFIYLRHYSVANDNLNVLLYRQSTYNISNQVTTNWLADGPNGSFLAIPTTGYNITFQSNANINMYTLELGSLGSVSVTDFIPSVLMYRMPSEIVECMQQAGYGYQGPIVDIQQEISDMKETLEDIKGDIEKTERTEEEQEEQETQMYEMSDTINDLVDTNESSSLISGFGDYFSQLQNTLTYSDNIDDTITLTLPFVNKTIRLSSGMLSYYVGSISFGPFGTFKDFVQLIWFFVFGGLIFQLIWRIVQYFSTGEFLNDEGYKTFRSILNANIQGITPLML